MTSAPHLTLSPIQLPALALSLAKAAQLPVEVIGRICVNPDTDALRLGTPPECVGQE
jgi:hypothetical protein